MYMIYCVLHSSVYDVHINIIELVYRDTLTHTAGTLLISDKMHIAFFYISMFQFLCVCNKKHQSHLKNNIFQHNSQIVAPEN